jgi:hypothetical protein
MRDNGIYVGPLSLEWSHVIRKLRAVGLQEEARRLAPVLNTMPPEETRNLPVGPFSTV